MSHLRVDPLKTWESQRNNVNQKLIPAIIKKLPDYKHHHSKIQKILKQHHKSQRYTSKIHNDPELKAYNLAQMAKNSKINEVFIGILI